MKGRFLPVTLLMLAAAAWGATFPLVKDVLRYISPEWYMMWRFLLAGTLMFLVVLWQGSLTRRSLAQGALLGVFVFTGYWAQSRGLMTIPPSRSAFLTGLCVVLVPFAALLCFRVRVPGRAIAAAILAAAGLYALAGPQQLGITGGDLLTLLAAVLFAFHILFAEKATQQSNPAALAAVQVLFVGLAAIPATALSPMRPMSRYVVAVIIGTAIVNTALAFFTMMWAQSRLTATEAGIILAFEPVAAAAVSVTYYGEKITSGLLIGGALIVGAMVISQFDERRVKSEE